MSIREQYKQECEQLQMFLGEIGELLERHSGFVQRESKFGGNELVQVMTLGCLENGKSSLTELCSVANKLGVSISTTGLHYRLNPEAVELLSQVFQLWVQHEQPSQLRQVLWGFSAVHIVDSSQITLAESLAEAFPGGRNPATMKIQLGYEYRSGRIEALWVENGRTPDQSSKLPEHIGSAGDLVLMDLGYTNQHMFKRLHTHDVYFLSRLQAQIGLYQQAKDSETIDLLAYVNQLPDSINMGECCLYLGQQAKTPVRVIYYRLPPAVAQERRRKAKQVGVFCISPRKCLVEII